MHRLFVAVDPPPALSVQLIALEDPDLAARWSPAGNHHLTLKFIGNVDSDKRDDVAHALAQIEGPAPRVLLNRLAVFPSWRRPSVLVLMAESDDALLALHQNVEDVLHERGIERETKPFRPHVTLARFKNASPPAVRAYVRDTALPRFAPFRATTFRLYESVTKPTGAEYTAIAEYPLHPST